jgi:hypothetical protein
LIAKEWNVTLYRVVRHDRRGGERCAGDAHDPPVEQRGAGNWYSALHAEASQRHQARKRFYGFWDLCDERALIIKRADDTWNVEVLKVTESAVDDTECIIRCRFSASPCFEKKRGVASE